jgi:glycine betaine catabolism B
MEFTLGHARPDSRGNRRYFTLASSPTEENLRLGVRFYENGSSFKKAFKDILSDAQTKLGIKVFYTLTNTKAIPRNWSGLSGRLNEQMILKAVPDYDERTFYLSGPPGMVRAHEQVLKNMRISHGQIKKDFFPGLV